MWASWFATRRPVVFDKHGAGVKSDAVVVPAGRVEQFRKMMPDIYVWVAILVTIARFRDGPLSSRGVRLQISSTR
jgi:hypothetical protein